MEGITSEWERAPRELAAGADSVLSYNSIGVTSLLSPVQGRDLVLVGGEVDLYVELAPASRVGRTLGESGIGARTGLNVIAVQKPGGHAVNPTPRPASPRRNSATR